MYCINPEDESIIHLDTGGKKVIEYNVILDNENRIVTVRAFLENKTVFRYMFNYYRDYLGMVNDGVYVARWLKDYKDDVFPTNFYGSLTRDGYYQYYEPPHVFYYATNADGDYNRFYLASNRIDDTRTSNGFINATEVLLTQHDYVLLSNFSLYKINVTDYTYIHLFDDVHLFSGHNNRVCVVFSNGTGYYKGFSTEDVFDCSVTHFGACFLYNNGTVACYDDNLNYRYGYLGVSSVIGDTGGVCFVFKNGTSMCDVPNFDIRYMCGNVVGIFPYFNYPKSKYCVYDGSSLVCGAKVLGIKQGCFFRNVYIENETLYLYPGNETSINIQILYSSGCVDGINVSIEHTSDLIVYVIPNTTNDTVINAMLHISVPSHIPAGKYDIHIKSRGCGGGTCS
ncbi:MAG: hypothetical protein DRH06_08480, partial [Deltaproteobacteria bacterium]